MRRSIAVLALLALFACTQPEPEPDVSDRSDWSVDVPETEKLASAEMKTSEEGPWTIRRTVSATPAKPGPRGRLDVEDGLAEGAAPPSPDAEMDRGGDAPPTGAPVAEAKSEAGYEPAADPAAPAVSGGRGDGGYAERPRANGSPLKAGTTDDNDRFDEFVAYLETWLGNQDGAKTWDPLDVRGRAFVRVVNEAGRPIPAARVTVVDEAGDAVLLRGTTYGDGRVPFYPRVASATPAAADLLVEVAFGETRERVRWDGKADLGVTLPVAEPVVEPVLLDVLFLIDTTGSMGDEIDRVKQSLLGVTAKLRSLSREFDLRYSAVLYRDVGDVYVTKSHPFTGDIEAFDAALQTIRAGGGGDGPESLNQGLAEAVGRDDWRDGAAKVMFLIADAPPHMDYEGDVPYGASLKAAVGKGIRIHSVAASGLPVIGSLVFRQVAQFTRGKFIFIEYGGDVAASGAAHGVKAATKSNNLDDILFEQIRDEVAHWGR